MSVRFYDTKIGNSNPDGLANLATNHINNIYIYIYIYIVTKDFYSIVHFGIIFRNI